MRILFFLLITAVLITGCTKKNRIPSNVLSPAKMQAVLWDMMRADQFLTDYVFARDTSKNKEKESIRMYEQIFVFHKINKEEFTKSFAFYRSHPLHLQVIMDSISKRKGEAPSNIVTTDTAPTLPVSPLLQKLDSLPAKKRKPVLPD
jgi:Domain of unknown function (DUF4296)